MGYKYEEDCVVPKFKQSSLRVMIWACIMKGNKGPMVVLEYPGGLGGGMTADWYQEQVLEKVLFDYYCQMSEERDRMEPLCIVPNPHLHGLREMGSKHSHICHLHPTSVPSSHYGTNLKLLSGNSHTLPQVLMS